MNAATGLHTTGVIHACAHCRARNRIPYADFGKTTRCGNCHTPLPPLAQPLDVEDDSSFESLIRSSALPVLVDFWADWCGPCKMMAPELERIANSRGGEIIVAKVNSDASPALAQQNGIAALPTLVLFVNGSEAARLQGARPAAEIDRFLSQSLG